MSEQQRDESIEQPPYDEASDGGNSYADDPAADLPSRVRAYERALLVSALAAAGGHQRRAAEILGILPTTLHEKLKRHGLRRFRPS
jgi:DNA-binding NtrC family response regulator